MFLFSKDDIIKSTKAVLVNDIANSDVVSYDVSTDSRKLKPGNLFIALKGDKFDGHSFIKDICNIDGIAILAEKQFIKNNPHLIEKSRGHIFSVDDTLYALGELAIFSRNSLPKDSIVIAVTGTAGKTSTKDMINHILSTSSLAKKGIVATEGNFNNLIGLPLTLFKIDSNIPPSFVVLEMGMNSFGEIKRLSEISNPSIRLITNIGMAHTEGVGDILGVARAKFELFDTANDEDILVINLDDPYISSMTPKKNIRKITYGSDKRSDIRLLKILSLSTAGTKMLISAMGNVVEIDIPLIGAHHSYNVMASLAVGYLCKISFDEMKGIMRTLPFSKMRMEILPLEDNITLLNDAYNANPSSMATALNALRDISNKENRRSIAILGDMLELGDVENELHFEVGKLVASLGISVLLACGKRSKLIVDGAISLGMDKDKALFFDNIELLSNTLNNIILKEDIVLLKASRGSKMERLLSYFKYTSQL